MTGTDELDPGLAAKTAIALWLHDTNGDVAVLGAEVDFLREALASGATEDTSEALTSVALRAARLANRQRAINDLLDWLWWPHRLQPLVDLDLNDVVRRWALLSPRLALRVRLDVVDGLPHVRGVAPAVISILDNLVSNACKYAEAPAGGVVIRIRQLEDAVVLECCDIGAGFEQEDLPHVFDLGYRGVRAGSRAEGSGTGLAGCALLARRMGAEIAACNADSGGAVVSLSFRVAGQHGGDPRLTPSALP